MTSSVVNVFFKVTRVCHGAKILRYPYFHAFLFESVDVEQTYSQLPNSGRYNNFVHDIKKAFPETMTSGGLATKFKLVHPGNQCLSYFFYFLFIFYNSRLIYLNNTFYWFRW